MVVCRGSSAEFQVLKRARWLLAPKAAGRHDLGGSQERHCATPGRAAGADGESALPRGAQARGNLGPAWNRVRLEFSREGKLWCGASSSGLRIRKLASLFPSLSSCGAVALGIWVLGPGKKKKRKEKV